MPPTFVDELQAMVSEMQIVANSHLKNRTVEEFKVGFGRIQKKEHPRL
jgi:hypothetical protein